MFKIIEIVNLKCGFMPKLKEWEIRYTARRVNAGRRDPMDVAREQLEAKRRISAQKIQAKRLRSLKRRKKAQGLVKLGLKELAFAVKSTRGVARGRRRR